MRIETITVVIKGIITLVLAAAIAQAITEGTPVQKEFWIAFGVVILWWSSGTIKRAVVGLRRK